MSAADKINCNLLIIIIAVVLNIRRSVVMVYYCCIAMVRTYTEGIIV